MREWLSLYTARVKEFALRETTNRSSRASVSLPRGVGQHLAYLACLFNNGAPIRLAASAEMAEIVRDLIELYEVFKLLSSTLHSGVQREILLLQCRKADWTHDLIKQLSDSDPSDVKSLSMCREQLDRTINSGNGTSELPARYAGRHQVSNNEAQQCTNCYLDERQACPGCLGPRFIDEVDHSKGLGRHWRSRSRVSTHALIYFDAGWGWEWPAHPIHSRGYDGRNGLMAAVQGGSTEVTQLILAENPDILATTYGADTVLHTAARYDREEILVSLLIAALTPSALPVVKIPPGDGVCRTELFAVPLADICSVLAQCEAVLNEHYRTDSTSYQPFYEPCPCRAIRPQKIWDEAMTTNGKDNWSYAECHGLSCREDLPIKKVIQPGAAELDSQLAATVAATTELPMLLADLGRVRNLEHTAQERNHSLLNALSIYRDGRNKVGRTALHSAAARDRDSACKLLMALGSDPSTRDRWCYSALQLMVRNIPKAAKVALEQYCEVDKASRQEMFFLRELECVAGSYNASRSPADDHERSKQYKGPYELILPKMNPRDPRPQTLLQEITFNDLQSCIRHPVLKQMVRIKWEAFGKDYHLFQIFKYVLFVTLWTIVACHEPLRYCTDGEYGLDGENKHVLCNNSSDLEGDDFFRMHYTIGRTVLEVIAFIYAITYIMVEVHEFKLEHSIKTYHRKNAVAMLGPQASGSFIHQYGYMSAHEYEAELEKIKKLEGKAWGTYFSDASNYIDFLTLLCLPLSSMFQVLNVSMGGNYWAAQIASWFLSVALLSAWVNILKYGRAYKRFGAFFVILSKMWSDTFLFLRLFLVFWVPTAAIFVLFFGGHDATKGEFENFFQSMFNMYKLAMVDFDDGDITSVAPSTARILYIMWVFMSAVVLLNLFIAMMGSSFQDDYDAKLDVAQMEKARVICDIEERLCNQKGANGFGLLALIRGESLNTSIERLQVAYANASTTKADDPPQEKIEKILSDHMTTDDWDDPDTEVNEVDSTRAQILLAVDKVLEQNKELSGKMMEVSQDMQTRRLPDVRSGGAMRDGAGPMPRRTRPIQHSQQL